MSRVMSGLISGPSYHTETLATSRAIRLSRPIDIAAHRTVLKKYAAIRRTPPGHGRRECARVAANNIAPNCQLTGTRIAFVQAIARMRQSAEGFQQLVRLSRLILGLCLFSGLAYAQFSPGPLSKAHTKLDGPTHCASCHVGGGGEGKLKCTGCHVEIKQRLAANPGLHPSLMGPMASITRRDDQCARCHSEHNGAQFVPIRWDVSLDEFDHRKAGYPLEGGHAGLKCGRCHTPDRIPAAARKTILMKDLRRTYLGLGKACLTCHQDQHRGQLGDQCERCHTAAKWKDVTRFDHSTAKFKLTGSPVGTECSKCHTTMPAALPGAAAPAAPNSARPLVRYVGPVASQL